jgi:predicted nucleic acid-binding protein
MKYVLDTSAWYAYVIDSDVAHNKALEFIHENPDLVVVYPVIEELAALIHHRRGKPTVIKSVYTPFFTSPNIQVEYPTSQIDQEIWALYKNNQNKIDYVDTCVFYYSRKLKLPIFTFDSHFKDLSPKPHLVPR